MARIFQRFLSEFTAQASASITADADSTGSQTAFDTDASGNLDGCEQAEAEVDVTTHSGADARAQIFYVPLQHDAVGDMENVFLGEVAIPNAATGKFQVVVDIKTKDGDFLLHAADVAFTASLSIRGIYNSDT